MCSYCTVKEIKSGYEKEILKIDLHEVKNPKYCTFLAAKCVQLQGKYLCNIVYNSFCASRPCATYI